EAGTVNNVDLSSVIESGETLTTFTQDLSTGVVTYTDEASNPFTAVVTSTDADNLLAVGADGGSYLDEA
ncbi:hypothetical protein JM658_17070, partial [Joostella atrarenae]|nr:hypothetical protein [Joostella atrarenae]